MNKVYCKKCIHYYVTWDVKSPNGCRIFEIKSKYLPSLVVFRTTGKICPMYTERKKR